MAPSLSLVDAIVHPAAQSIMTRSFASSPTGQPSVHTESQDITWTSWPNLFVNLVVVLRHLVRAPLLNRSSNAQDCRSACRTRTESVFVGFMRSSNSNSSCRRRLAQGANESFSKTTRPCSLNSFSSSNNPRSSLAHFEQDNSRAADASC